MIAETLKFAEPDLALTHAQETITHVLSLLFVLHVTIALTVHAHKE